MKRSEMVKIIEKAMRCWNGAYYNQSLESHILEYIEEAGMLPPEVDDYTNINCMGLGETIDKYFYWEPEDD